MSLFRLGIAAAATFACAAPAVAGETGATAGKPQVYVCDRPTPAKHVQSRDGARLQFVSARELLADSRPTAKPRCITAAELQRYRTLHAQRSHQIASR